MRPDKGVHKRRGSAAWQHRIFVPADLRHHYKGKSVLGAVSLHTSDLAEANSRARKRVGQYEAEFDAFRHGGSKANASADKRNLTPRLIETLAERHRRSIVDTDFADSAAAYTKAAANPLAFWRGEIIPIPDACQIPHYGWSAWDALCADEHASIDAGVAFLLNARRKIRLDKLRQALRVGNVKVLASTADDLLSSYQHDAGKRLMLIKRLIEVEIGALASILDKEAVHFPGVFDDGVDVAEDDGTENPLLSVATKAWIAEKSSLDLTPRRIEDCQAAVSLFTEVVGDKPIGNYSKGDVRQFKDVLRKLPSNRNKRRETRGLSIQAAISKAEKLGLNTMATKTANNKYLGALFNLFEYAIGNYDKVDRNPFQNATLPTTSTPREEWDPFSLEALRKFFNSPLYRGCKSDKYWLEPGPDVPRDSVRFWLPLVLLYTGARVNEACKLRTADIGEEGGIPYFDIVWEEDDEETGVAGRVKNASSKRRVPLHDDLVSFGFLEFVARARSRGQERLFAELKPNRYGKLYGTISQRFSDTYLPKLGIKTDKTSMKSFRHNFVDAAKNSRMPDDIILALRGDTQRGMLGRYGHGKTDLEILAAEIAKLKFKGLCLDHLVVSTGTA